MNKLLTNSTTQLKSKKKKKNGTKLRRQKRTPAAAKTIPTAVRQYMQLIANPCHGPLVRSVGPGGSLVERVRKTITIGTTPCGYICFFPAFHGGKSTAGNTNQSIFLWENALASTQPTNSLAAPLGSGGTGGTWVEDPATSLISSTSAFSRAKTLSACMQLEYIGAISTMAGQVCIVKNISLSSLNRNVNSVGTEYQMPSVEELFSHAAVRERYSLSGHEVIARPTDAGYTFRDGAESNNTFVTSSTLIPDTVFSSGVAGTNATWPTCSTPDQATAVIIAWRGIPLGATLHSINLVKVVELELSARNNQIEASPVNETTLGTASSYFPSIQSVVDVLDKYTPSWQYRLMNYGAAAVKTIADVYAPSVLAAVSGPSLRRSIMN